MNAPSRTFTASPAIRTQVPLLVGIMSPSGGGKTYSALRLATGMQQVFGGDIYGIDTENNRMLHYADQFKFKHVPFSAPFGSLDYLAALKWCSAQGSRITIVDSMTHEHVGEGGYLETAEAVVDRIAGTDYKKREAVKMLGWAKAGPLRQKMIEGIKQIDGAFIFCFRAKEKVKPVRKAGGGTEVIDMGFMPIAGEEWVYEMALNCMLEPRSEGVPTWRSDHVGERMMMKLPTQFKGVFSESTALSEDIGRQLAEWAKGGKTTTAPTVDSIEAINKSLSEAAALGMESLRVAWTKVPKEHQGTLKAALERVHKPTARQVDEKPVEGAGFDDTPEQVNQSQASTQEGNPAQPSPAASQPAPESGSAASTGHTGAGAAPETAAAEIKTEKEYIAHARAWIGAATDADQIEKQWAAEKKVRNQANVTAEIREALDGEAKAKAVSLRPAKQKETAQ